MKQINEIEALFDQMNAEMSALKANYQKRGQEIFKLAFKEFFDANPEVHVVGWRQFTPYFNDGDTCEFSCYAEYAFVSNAKDYDEIRYGEYGGDQENVWVADSDYGDFNEELIPQSVIANTDALRSLLSKIDNDVFLDMFGDHAQVFATREGFDVHEYSHD
jgi:hypothetical protein